MLLPSVPQRTHVVETWPLLSLCSWGNFFITFNSHADHNASWTFIVNMCTHASCSLKEKELSNKDFFFLTNK